ncbi:MAG: hypothetical protein KA419_13630 [Acidobacteria bacterium]|nr:hypothetical protein [Acidobacteriota bacterium]
MSEKAKQYPFWLKTGEGLHSLEELMEALSDMPDSTYNDHVNPANNDFSNWLRDILELQSMAEAIRHARSPLECLRIIRESLQPGPRPYRKWHKEDISRLKRLFPAKTNQEVARLMGRSLVSISSMAFKLGLRKHPEFKAQLGRLSMSRRWGVPLRQMKRRRRAKPESS